MFTSNLYIHIFVYFIVINRTTLGADTVDVDLLTVNDVEVVPRVSEIYDQGTSMPESIGFQVRIGRERGILRLVKIPPLTTYVLNKEQYYKTDLDREDLAAYKDDSCKAVILLTQKKHPLKYHLEGHFQIGLRLLHIKPDPDTGSHILVRQDTLLPPNSNNFHGNHRSKRSLTVYTLELGLVADYENFLSFMKRNNNDTNLAEAEMRNYFAFIAEKMRVRYHHINEVDGTIAFEIISSALIIIESRNDAWFTENFVINGTSVDSKKALEATSSWYLNPPAGITLPPSDHFMFFTGYNLQYAENLANAGLAFTGAMCLFNTRSDRGISTSIVEDHRDGETGVTASHELGHALNASHDSKVGCSDINSYIMSTSNRIIQEEELAQRPWQFSTCSVRDMKAFVERTDVDCLNDNRYGDGVVTSTERAGHYFTVDEQCKMKHGTDSKFCEFAYREDKAKLCYLMFCTLGDGCTSARAMEYTECDTGKWCHRGLCINANNTEPKIINLPNTAVEITTDSHGVVYTVEAYDPDLDDVLTFHKTWDPALDGGYFRFNDTTRQLSVKAGAELKKLPVKNFSLILSVDDGILRSLPVNIDFTIVEPKVNQPPVFGRDIYQIQAYEGKKGDVVIPTMINYVFDPDSTLTFSLISSNLSSYFNINATTGRVTYAEDYDADPTRLPSSLILGVRVTDDGGLTALALFNITLGNVNQHPIFHNLPNEVSLPENTAVQTVIFTVSATDPDSADVLSYTFSNPDQFVNTYLAINSSTGVITLKSNNDLDFETMVVHTYSIIIAVGNTHHQMTELLVVNVVNVNEPPEFTRINYNATTRTGPAGRIIVPSLLESVSDPDFTDVKFKFSIQNDTYSRYFDIDPANGEIKFATDYGTDRDIFPRQVALVVRATDTANATGSAIFTITIKLANQKPEITNLPDSVTVSEDTAVGSVLFIVNSTDNNTEDQITYITSNNGSQFVFIDDNGRVILNKSLDYETLQSVQVEIKAFDGRLFSEPSILTIMIQNVNERPEFSSIMINYNIMSGKTGDVAMSNLSSYVINKDIGEPLVFSIIRINTQSMFNINQSTGIITYSSDFLSTSPSQVILQISVTDGTSQADITTLIFNITDDVLATPTPQTAATVVTTTSSRPGTTSVAPGTTSSEPNTSSLGPGTTSSGPDTTSLGPGTTSSGPDTTSLVPGTMSSGPDTTSLGPGTTSSGPGAFTITNLPKTITIAENLPTNSSVYKFTTDYLGPVEFVFQQISGPPETFYVNGNELKVKNGALLDFETVNEFELSISARSGQTSSIPGRLTITLQNVNEPPRCLKGIQTIPVVESLKIGTELISNLTQQVKDPEGHTNFLMTIRPTTQSEYFMINSINNSLLLAKDFTSAATDSLTVAITFTEVSDLTKSDTCSFKFTFSNQPPLFVNLPMTIQIPSNTVPLTNIFTIKVTDPDINDFLKVNMVATPTFYFTFNPQDYTVSIATGAILPSSATYTLMFEVSDGQFSSQANLTVSIIETSTANTGADTTRSLVTTVTPSTTTIDGNDVITSLMDRPWAIAAIAVSGILILSFIVLTICLIRKRRTENSAKEKILDSRSFLSDRTFETAFTNPGYALNRPIDFYSATES